MTPSTRRRLLYATAIPLGLLLLTYFGSRLVLGYWVTAPWAGERLSDAMGREVTVEAVRVSLRPGWQVRLEGVSVGRVITSRAAEVRLHLLPLLKGSVEASRIRLEGVRLRVERRPDGDLALLGLAPDEGEPDVRTSFPALPALVVQDAEIEFVDRAIDAEAEPIRVLIQHLVVRDLREGETARFDLHTRFGEAGRRGALELSGSIGPLSADQNFAELPLSARIETRALDPALVVPYLPESWLFRSAQGALDAEADLTGRLAGDLEGGLAIHFRPGTVDFAGIRFEGANRFEAQMRVKDGSLAFSDGRLRADEASLGRFSAHDVEAVFAYSDQTLAFESLVFEAFAGTWRQTGSVTFRGPPAFEVETHVEDVHVERVVQSFTEETMVEFVPTLLRADGSFRGHWTGEADWLAPIEGSGRLELRNGEMPRGTLMGSVAEAMMTVVPASLREAGRSKRPKTTRLDHCTLTFSVSEGLIRTQDLELVTDDYQMNGAGTMASDLGLDFRAHVIFSGQGMDKLILMAGVSSGTETQKTVPPIPLKVRGTLTNPQFAPELPGVRAATMGVLVWGGRASTGVAAGAFGKARQAAGGVVRQGTRLFRDSEPDDTSERAR